MSQENLDLVMRAMRAAVRQPRPDFDTMNALYHRDHVLVSIAASKLGAEGDAVGGRGYKAWMEAQQDVVSWETELGGAIDAGPDTVIAVMTTRFRGASSGAVTDQHVWMVVTVKDGQITRTEMYIQPAEAFAAATGRAE